MSGQSLSDIISFDKQNILRNGDILTHDQRIPKYYIIHNKYTFTHLEFHRIVCLVSQMTDLSLIDTKTSVNGIKL